MHFDAQDVRDLGEPANRGRCLTPEHSPHLRAPYAGQVGDHSQCQAAFLSQRSEILRKDFMRFTCFAHRAAKLLVGRKSAWRYIAIRYFAMRQRPRFLAIFVCAGFLLDLPTILADTNRP